MTYSEGTRPTAPVGECGHPTYRAAKVCRSCYLAANRRITQSCDECGAPVSTKKSKLCRACWMRHHMEQASRPTCQDCGKEISWSLGREKGAPKRCMPCRIIQMKARPAKQCSVEGCERKHKAHGLCKLHYTMKNFRERQPWSGVKAHLAKMPCTLCGYDRMRSHVHRLGHKGGYEWGRCIPLCQRCHDEIIRGLTPEPAAGVPMPTDFVEIKRRPARTATNARLRPLTITPT